MTPESRRQYIDSIIDTLRSREHDNNSPSISDFDKARLFSSLGLLIHDGLSANAAATQTMTGALEHASSDLRLASTESANTSRQLKNYTVVLAIATGLLVITSGWQAWETRQAHLIGAPAKGVVSSSQALPTPAVTPAQVAADKQEYLAEVDQVSRQVIALAQATPAEKFSWRPAPGVRSISEAYMHIAGGNAMLLGIAGIGKPADLPKAPDVPAIRKLEQTVTPKAEVVDWLKRTFAAVKSAYTAADLTGPANFFGQKTTVRAIYMRILVHSNEHMGQSIAYARMNGIVPPWSEPVAKKP